MNEVVSEGNSNCTLEDVKSCINSIIQKVRYTNEMVMFKYSVKASEEPLGTYYEVVFDIVGTEVKYTTVGNYMFNKIDVISKNLVEIYEKSYPIRYRYEKLWNRGVLSWGLVECDYGDYYLDDHNHPQLFCER